MTDINERIKTYATEYIDWHNTRIMEWDLDYWYTRCEFLKHEVDTLKKEIASLKSIREEIDNFVTEDRNASIPQ